MTQSSVVASLLLAMSKVNPADHALYANSRLILINELMYCIFIYTDSHNHHHIKIFGLTLAFPNVDFPLYPLPSLLVENRRKEGWP